MVERASRSTIARNPLFRQWRFQLSWPFASPLPRNVGPVVTDSLDFLRDEIVGCRVCPRLVEWRERVADEKRAAFRDDTYWGRPVPGFGDTAAPIVVVGLAPAAHGANRTGRVFTGDRSGDWLFRALYRAGLANQPQSVSADDGLQLHDVWITAPVRCAPPDNRPMPAERDACAPFLARELELIKPVVVVCLGAFALAAVCRHFAVRPRPRFGHGVELAIADGPTLLCSYHPSQQNTFTGKLTEAMLDDVIIRAVTLAANRTT
jgi:uracil-DNA glycosylase